MSKLLRNSIGKRMGLFILVLCSCCSIVLSQQNGDGDKPAPEGLVIAPQVLNAKPTVGEGLSVSSFSPPMKGKIIYSPRNIEKDSLYIYIDEKTNDGVRRTFYDFNSRLVKRGPHDISKTPDYITSPKSSSDGGQLVFKVKVFDIYYKLFSLNLKTNQVFKISDDFLAYYYISVSPDGKHVAFVKGGDTLGNVYETQIDAEYYTGPLKLFVADVNGENKQLVAQGNSLNGQLKWDDEGNLFYGVEAKSDGDKTATDKSPQLNIYSFDAKLKKSTLLVENGVMPSPSPNGKGVIFFGPPNKSTPVEWGYNWRNKSPFEVSLCYAATDGNRRIAFEPVGRMYPDVHWLPDNKSFVSLRETTSTPNATGELRSWNTETQDTKLIAQLKAKDVSESPRSTLSPQFCILNARESSVLVATSEFLADTNNKGTTANVRESVFSVDLANGQVVQELTAVNTLFTGYDIRVE